jgi:MATE family multidrug resistance protein
MALAIALGLLVLQSPLRTAGFTLLSTTETVKAAGQDYYNAMIWGAPASLLGFVLLGWFLGRGQGGKVLVLSIVGNGSNVLLNYLFIVQMDWGSAGAGWATAASQMALAIAGLGLVATEVSPQQIRRIAPQIWRWADLKTTLMLNGDIMVRTFALIMTFSVFTNLSSAIGTVVLASHTLMLQLISFSAYFIDGIAFATESYTGILQGKGQLSRLVPLLKLAGGISVGIGAIFALGAIAAPGWLFGLLTSHAPVLNHVQSVVGWLLPVLGIGAIAYMLDGYFLGLTQGRILRNAALISAIVGFLPLAFLAWYYRSEQILWLALVGFMVARVITLASQVPKTLAPITPTPDSSTNDLN